MTLPPCYGLAMIRAAPSVRSSRVLEILRVTVEVQTIASTGVNSPAFQRWIDCRDGRRKIRINHQLHITGARHRTNGRVVGGAQIGYRLRFGFGPEILEHGRCAEIVGAI